MADFKIIRGDTEDVVVTFTDSAGSPIDLTGKTVFFTVKKKSDLKDTDDTDAVIQKDITSHTNPTQGITTISLTSTDTNQEPDFYFYDLQIKDGTTITSTVRDELQIIEDITKRTS